MPLDGSPDQWLATAHEHLRTTTLDVSPRICAFHAQQACEHAVKAVLAHLEIDFPWTHDLTHLAKLVPDELSGTELADVGALTPFAVSDRYPPVRDLDRAVVDEATHVAQGVVKWADRIVDGG